MYSRSSVRKRRTSDTRKPSCTERDSSFSPKPICSKRSRASAISVSDVRWFSTASTRNPLLSSLTHCSMTWTISSSVRLLAATRKAAFVTRISSSTLARSMGRFSSDASRLRWFALSCSSRFSASSMPLHTRWLIIRRETRVSRCGSVRRRNSMMTRQSRRSSAGACSIASFQFRAMLRSRRSVRNWPSRAAIWSSSRRSSLRNGPSSAFAKYCS